MFISRNSFAREELHKRPAEKGECNFCGNNKKLWIYYIEPDSIRYRRNDIKGKFCSIGCMKNYNNWEK